MQLFCQLSNQQTATHCQGSRRARTFYDKRLYEKIVAQEACGGYNQDFVHFLQKGTITFTELGKTCKTKNEITCMHTEDMLVRHDT